MRRDDSLSGMLDGLVRGALTLGGLALAVGLGFLLFYFFGTGQIPPEQVPQAKNLIEMFGNVSLVGALVASVALAFVWWGEEILAAVLLILAALVYFGPGFLPMAVGGTVSEVQNLALQKVQAAGGALGLVAVIVTILDVAGRVKSRVAHGSKAESIKYGKGVKEDVDRQNVFLGKCWQLPYCRKFVREKCPIYHARRTCWKERVGCMCEESVIANAMAGTTIPRDMIAAAKFIPYNQKLPMQVKIERCRQCVIYNEHQRQKYKLLMPTTFAAVLGLYVLTREPLKAAIGQGIVTTDRFLGGAMMTGRQTLSADLVRLTVVQEVLAVALMLILLSYAMKLLEHIIFTLKA